VTTLAVVDDSGPRPPDWAPIAERGPQLVVTAWRYLDQIALSLRPATVDVTDVALRGLAQHLVAGGLDGFAAVERRHIESYKQWLATAGTRTGRPPARNTIRQRLGLVRSFFDRIIEWDWADAPRRTPMFAIDVPVADDPLPRFLDDAQAARLLAAAAHAEPLDRLVVELLARTGLARKRTLRPRAQCGRAYRRRLVAAGPGRQTPQRPLHPPAPRPRRPPRRLAHRPPSI
jgi:integrase